MELELPDAEWRRGFRRRLLAWYRKHARDLPWRRTKDAYRIWVSEIMLQQTQVATVIPYYERFTARFPDVAELASADEQEVLRWWEGLGYYRRARQMHQAAREIADRHRGEFPTRFDDVVALPGIGRYTAGAILSIADDQRQPIVEANTIRLYCRLLAHRDDPTTAASQKRLWGFAQSLLPRTRPGQLNQALMELGATLCKPQSPKCSQCPVRAQCPTFENQWHEQIPAPKKKSAFVQIREAAVVLRHQGRILVRKCGESERWAGLWDFPRFAIASERRLTPEDDLVRGVRQLTRLEIEPGKRILRLKHAVTKYRITLDCFEAVLKDDSVESDDALRWLTLEELVEAPLNSTGRKVVEHLQQTLALP